MATAHHAQLANLAAMARSIFHQVGATEVEPELTTLVNFNGTNGEGPTNDGSLIADAHGDLFGTTVFGGNNGFASGDGTVFEIAKTAHGTTLVNFNDFNGTKGHPSIYTLP
jgi:uncharacterized repeat protein (TIGR03803 family)